MHWDFNFGALKMLHSWRKLENLMIILWGPLSSFEELGSSPFAAWHFPEVSLSNRLKLKGIAL